MSYRRVSSALRADASFVVELLESRQLLSASLIKGVLRIDGTAAADKIRIIDADRRGNLVVDINGHKSVFNRKLIRRIDVDGKQGLDRVYAKFVSGRIRGRSLRLLNPTVGHDQLSVSGSRASLAGLVVKVGANASTFSPTSSEWTSVGTTQPVRWSAVQVASSGSVITSVLTSAVMSTAVVAAPSQSIWPASTVPKVEAVTNDIRSSQLGVEFQANVAGSINGIRFYKGPGNTGTHTGLLWTMAGQLLAKVTFANETDSGWQQALFSAPVSIRPGTSYIASYIAPNGAYAQDPTYFSGGPYTRGDLTAINSLYAYKAAYPQWNWRDSNYYVDVVFTPQPAAPTALSATAISSSQINLAWADNSNNESGFKIERKVGADGAWAQIATAGENATSFRDMTVVSGTQYFYRVEATNSGGDSAYTNEATATTPSLVTVTQLQPPAAPTSLSASVLSSSAINLAWADNSSNETGFRLDRKIGATGVWTQIATLAPNTMSFSDTSLAAGTQYDYRIAAIGDGGTSSYSNEAAATTLIPLPAAPSSLVASDISSSLATLTWTDNSNNETGFAVERKLAADAAWTRMVTLGANATSYIAAGLSEAATYSFRVLAINTGGASASPTVTATTLPAAPTALTAIAANSTQVNLHWTDNSSGESGYKIERKLGAAGTWSEIAAVGANVTSWSNTGLTQNTNYVYRVCAYTPVSNSGYSAEVSVTTPLPMGAPSGLAATVMSGVEVDLKWADNSGDETGFKIERSTNGINFTQIATVAANATAYADTSVSGGTRYWYRVRAAGTGGDSAYSAQVDVTTAPVLVPGAGFAGVTPQPDPVGTVGAAGYDAMAIARWDVVPYQTFDGAFNVGVVAFHMNDIDHVSFSVNGGPWSDVYSMTVNPQTGNHSNIGVQSDGVVEYWATLRAADFQDGQVEVRAIAWPKVGVPRVLESLAVFANSADSLNARTVYVSSHGTDTNDGSQATPFATLSKALDVVPDGGNIIILDAGTYPVALSKARYDFRRLNTRWITVRAADGLAAADVVIAQPTTSSIRPNVRRVRWQGLTFDFGTISQYYDTADETVWFDNCRWVNSLGWTTPMTTIPARQAVYITNCSAEEMQYGFAGDEMVRNSALRRISGDAFQNSRLVLNSTVDTMDHVISGTHNDVLQYFSTLDNVIVFGVTATNIRGSQGIFLDKTNSVFTNMAFVNVTISTLDTGLFSQMASSESHILFEGVRDTQQMLLRTDVTSPFVAHDVVFDDCLFASPLNTPLPPGVAVR